MRPIGPALCLAIVALLASACGRRTPETTPEGLPRTDTGPEQRTALGLTALNNGLALVRETRRVVLPPGRQLLRFTGVSDEVIPESVRVEIPGQVTAIVFEEQNYDADLITPGRVAESAVGATVRAYVANPRTGDEDILEGTLLSGPRGAMIETTDGITELPAKVRLTVAEMPPNLVSRPTLSWIVDAGQGGSFPIEVIYLTRGISWRADYVVDIDQRHNRARVQGWATVDNRTALTLADAQLQLLAGDVNQVGPLRLEQTMIVGLDLAEAEPMSAALPDEEALFEYHLYTVPRPLTIGARQQKQVALVAAEEVPFEVTHLARVLLDEVTRPLKSKSVRLSLEHEEEGPMGVPLPGGRAVLWIEDIATGQRIQVGEHLVDHIPVGEPLVIESPGDPAINGKWIPDRHSRDDLNRHFVDGALTVRNNRGNPTPLELILRVPGNPQVEVEVDGVVLSGGYGLQVRRYEVTLEPDEEKKLTVRTRR